VFTHPFTNADGHGVIQEPVVLGIDLLGNCSLRRLKRLLLVPYLLHSPGQSLDR